MRKILFLSLFIGLNLSAFCQKNVKDDLTVIFYNVENLFDTLDSPDTDDAEFTPGSEKNWNREKYNKKIQDISRVLSSVNTRELPEIIGLAEIENLEVLTDLINTEDLRRGDYKIIHRDSPDDRGVDVALLYRKNELKKVNHDFLRVSFPFDTTLHTRDILHVEGTSRDGEKIHFFVNHWSSRYGGTLESEPKRLECALVLRKKLDSILNEEKDPRFVIMGDFNDEPTNKSLMKVLLACDKRKNIYPGDLYNLYYDRHNLRNVGTYNYRGTWNMLDQVIVSYNMLNHKDFYSCDYEDAQIVSEEWMIYKNSNGVKVPNRTYGGPNYYGGISDHFPVFVRFVKDIEED